MFVDGFPYASLEGSFCQNILKGAFDHSTIEETNELVFFSQNRFFPRGSSSTYWKKGHNRLEHLKNNLPGFLSVWDMVMAKALQQ